MFIAVRTAPRIALFKKREEQSKVLCHCLIEFDVK